MTERSRFLNDAIHAINKAEQRLAKIESTSPDRDIAIAQCYALIAIADALETLAAQNH